MSDSFHPETLAVHAGRRIDPATGAVTPNLTLSTTFERAADGSLPHGLNYTRLDNPNRHALEEALAALEGGREALAFASGQAATAALLQALSPGDTVLLPDDIYHGTRVLAETVLGRWGLRVVTVDFTDSAAVAVALEHTAARLLWIETPSNPRLKITDVRTVARLARAAGALVVADNTWATPILQRVLELGAHVALHSTTKYIGGHSDALGGAVIFSADAPPDFVARVRENQRLGGGVPAPFDCWLLLRSLATLPLRVRAQSATAAQLAVWLATEPAVARVYYPGLPVHSGHAINAAQMSSGGAMISFEVHGGFAAASTVAARVKLITRATSLGGVESLIEHRKLAEGPHSPTPDNLLRLSVGLEHVDDLRADLAQAITGLAM
ncbi:PLP-dependent aspartate aminotransferase family protein [Horticoccus luteus]|uniref:PLP-dependent aspartate aminotransferase family protein n=1 Tax=Horticoccus luteus TaxID=2862869 RepID=A0A8F9XLQ6_9BACT|nr:PLP-dependent aspartate aminotransferase family protein [Horticoccus luteus]QYM79466.1 PLP-dependent aspartate aminotransferase family protein [Horticoccus luteus]